MWFVFAYGARKFSPPSSSNSEERTLPAVCGTSCFRCSQGQWKAFIVVFHSSSLGIIRLCASDTMAPCLLDERGPLLARVHTRRRYLGVAFRAGTRPVVTAAHGASLSTFPASWCSARGYSSQALQLPGTR
ncbi:uncharacterized protein LOC144111482 [Amblyomma americanum]